MSLFPSNKTKRMLGAAGLMMVLFSAAVKADDWQNWNNAALRWYDGEIFHLTAAMEIRITDDISDATLFRVGQAAGTSLAPWLRADIAYRYTEAKVASGSYRHQHRAEFQLTPHHALTDQLAVSFRNRVEWRWTQGAGQVNERTRHRLQFNLSTPDWRPLRGLYASNELFYDFNRERTSENRFIPLGLTFRLHDQASLGIHYMLRSTRGADSWSQAHVIGTALSVSL